MIKRKGILASEMNSLLADLSDSQKETARQKFKDAKEKSYDTDKRVNPDYTKEEKEFVDDELDKATYNGKYSGRDKNDNVMPMINKLNNFVKNVNSKLKSEYSDKYYASYNVNPIALLFSVYEIFKFEGENKSECDFYAYVDRNKDENDVTLNNLAEKIESLVSQMNVKYGNILKDCVKDLKSSNSEAVEECGVQASKGFYAPDFKSDVEYDLDAKYNFDEYDMKLILKAVERVIKMNPSVVTYSTFADYIGRMSTWSPMKVQQAANKAMEIYKEK